ncbi:FAD-dependent oxidoreductase [Variovorax sp. J22R24]|uniref:FAD-dependent oxidoreductase n=1 Tax=Variovorax gracilis TaxID=3053502 RepID=UPI0025786B72|nr:FAD-dependent oxidoreductase [Variovorax sp. J22R24]MDM0106757.1 FAD-dependent oxidoreductase [Variovorax sp. J22R24]
MRVVVLGAGLLGVTSAYYLQQLGHEVIVVDRHATPAAKARGRVAPKDGAATPHRPGSGSTRIGSTQGRWARLRAGMRRRVSKLLDRAIGARAQRDPREHLVRLAAYSRKSARVLRDEAGLPHGSRVGGLLNVFTCPEAFRARLARAPHWSELGCEEQLFSPDDAMRMEPALRAMCTQLAGATYSVEDPARDPSQFAASLVFLCRAAGVRFLTKHTVVSLKDRDGRIDRVELLDPAGRPMTLRAQAYVLALGASSVPHAEYLGVDMPLSFVREYIVTIPVKDAARAPRVALRDLQGKLRINRIETPEGDHLRVTATVRAGLDEDREPDSDRFNAILSRVEMLLPGAADTARASLATEMHAVSTNSLPMIGKTRLPNLFLNTAPGTPSWINALGAGKSIARIVSGLRPELQFAFRGL